jgi:hypothetical protein
MANYSLNITLNKILFPFIGAHKDLFAYLVWTYFKETINFMFKS